MKSIVSTILAAGCLLTGCARDPNRIGVTNPNHPGPAAGRALGAGAGAVAGNVAGGAVGFGEGVAAGAAAPFNNTRRVVRTWKTMKTADGRVIQVPVDTVVDEYGRPVGSAAAKPESK